MMRKGVSVIIAIAVLCAAGIEGAFEFGDVFSSVKDYFGLGNSHVNPSAEREIRNILHLNNVSVVDHMQEGLPRVRLGHRVTDLFHGWHFDDVLSDCPDSVRPSSVVVFYNSSDPVCMREYNALNWDKIAEASLPARSQLFTARYDMFSAPRRTWFAFTPEMDLEARFSVTTCPEVVFVSRKCDGFTKWCSKGKDPTDTSLELFGCKEFVEQCVPEYRKKWNKQGDMIQWIKQRVAEDGGSPKLSKFLGSYTEQGSWIQKREYTTNNEQFRNVYLAQAFPAFTHRGFKVVPIPSEVQDWLLQFMKDYEKQRRTEHWNAESTQMSFHEKPTTFVDMDLVRAKKEQMARKYLQPIVEEWSGMKPLELTSFYGMREYHEGAWLREHVDRIDTHVLSITLSVAKRNFTFDKEGKYPYKPWPLQVIDWTGQQVAYDHPPGTMILYESSKLPHGRPTRNEGGIHVGCFVHFKPLNMHGSDAKKWEDITAKARKNQQIHTEFATFRATPEIEPANPVFAEDNVGDQSIWVKQDGSKSGAKTTTDDKQFSVELKNRSDRSLQVYWYHESQTEPVLQGSAWPGAGFTLNTYHGHTFFWAELNSDKPVVGGKFTIDVGKKVYEYSFKQDGTVAKASEWAEKVKEKIKIEDELLG